MPLRTLNQVAVTSFWNEVEKIAGQSLRKELLEIKDALQEVVAKPMTKEHRAAYSRHSALNAGQGARQLRYLLSHPNARASSRSESLRLRLLNLLNSAAFTAMPPTHHEPGSLKDMASGVGTHREWFLRGYKPWKHAEPRSAEPEKLAKVVVVNRPTKFPLLPGDLTAYRKREAQVKGTPGDGSSLGRDKDGYYCYTHRARSKSYPSPSQIPLDRIRFIGSTA